MNRSRDQYIEQNKLNSERQTLSVLSNMWNLKKMTREQKRECYQTRRRDRGRGRRVENFPENVKLMERAGHEGFWVENDQSMLRVLQICPNETHYYVNR